MGMRALDIEGHDRALGGRVAEDLDRVDAGEPFHGVGRELRLMGRNGLEPD